MTRRDGFTLIEVVVALVLSVILVASGRLYVEQLGTNVQRSIRLTDSANAAANGVRVLRSLVGQVDQFTDTAARFAGDASAVSFTSWCRASGGWEQPCAVRLAVGRDSVGVFVRAEIAGRPPLICARAKQMAAIRYLVDPANGGAWTDRWVADREVPAAVGVVIDSDTLVLRPGAA